MKRWIKNNSLGITMFIIFVVLLVGQSITGFRHYNEDQQTHQQPEVSYGQYLKSGDFIEATFENWESEFLQMGSYVLFTVYLVQKGSTESKKLRGQEDFDRQPKKSHSKDTPWPVRKGGIALKVYEHSLSIAFILLFIMSIGLHAYGGSRATCEENLAHGETTCQSTIQYMGTSKMWFESFQNWQSEFLAVFAIVVFTIYLREKGSPESKAVSAPHAQTGNE